MSEYIILGNSCVFTGYCVFLWSCRTMVSVRVRTIDKNGTWWDCAGAVENGGQMQSCCYEGEEGVS